MNNTLPAYTALVEKSWNDIKNELLLVGALTAIMFAGVGALGQLPWIGWILGNTVGAGYIACLLKLRNKEEFGFEDFLWSFKNFNRFLNVLIANSLKIAMLVLGYILLIVPGIYLSVALSFMDVILVKEDTDALASIRKSMDFVKGRWWYMSGLLFVILLLNILGCFCFVIGLLFSVPVSVLMLVNILDQIKAEAGSPTPSSGSSLLQVNPGQ